MNNIEKQVRTDLLEFIAILFYTIIIFAFGFFFALMVVPKNTNKNQIEPTEYILPDAPATGMYVSNNKFKF